MVAILRPYALVLWGIVSRPWTLLMLGIGVLYVGPLLGGGLLIRGTDRATHDSVPVFSTEWTNWPPTMSGDQLPDGDMATMAGWDSRWRQPRQPLSPQGLPSAAEADWPILDRLPALDQLFIGPSSALSAAGWRRIGAHERLVELSLWDVSSDDDAPTAAPQALARLHRLERLDFRPSVMPKPYPNPNNPIVLPPLPSLEVAVLSGRSLEENLAALAAGAPRLHTLGLVIWLEDLSNRRLVEGLRRIPHLQTLYVGGQHESKEDPRYREHIERLRKSLPGVHVLPGTYSSTRVLNTTMAALVATYLPFVFWFQAGILLATPLAWMMPRRLAPHLFWPLAVAVLISSLLVAIARSVGVAWMPAITLAIFVTGLAAYGPVSGDVDGMAARITRLVVWIDALAAIGLGATAIGAGPMFDRWLSGDMPLRSLALLVLAAGVVGWKVVRLSRLPVILAGTGKSAPPGLVLDTLQSLPRERGRGGIGSFDLRWWLADSSVDRQLARPVPASFTAMLRRPQSREQLPITMAVMFVVMFIMTFLIGRMTARGTVQALPPFSAFAPMTIGMSAWQGYAMALSMTITLWFQRRGSLVIDFLRPVSRADYWRGLRQAIAHDLVLPASLGATCLVVGVVWSREGGPWAWGVAGMVFVGTLAMVHALTLLLAVTRWPLVVGTLTAILLVAASIGALVAMGYVLSVSKPDDLRAALLVAGAILIVGLGLRAGVLWRLEEREIG